ncbi:MAG: MopE-related protein, partial [Myxococcota bacterium]
MVRFAIVLGLAMVLGCGGDGSGTSPDGSTVCGADSECDDGVFCNGAETCDMALGCLPASAPCIAGQTCNEAMDACLSDCDLNGDADGDGVLAVECGGADCDDADGDRFPGNVEVCDSESHDEDCDPQTYGFRDADSDGSPDERCCNEGPDGLVCGTDCDDMQSVVHPGEAEGCDQLDNDCDGTVDEGALRSFHPDIDFDGFGDAMAMPVMQCAPPIMGTFVENAGDCDDGDFGISPAADESCNDVDDDCDSMVDEEPEASMSCDAPNGMFACMGGSCALVGCIGRFGDCDMDLSTGCETDTQVSAEHCGTCDNSCGAGGVCTAGVCDTVVRVVAGRSHTCAVRSSGSLACWGTNADGQLGDGTRTARSLPVVVPGLSAIDDVAPSATHTCARATDGSVFCWGLNDQGQLGDGGTTDRAVVAPVSSLRDTIDSTTRLFSGTVAQTTATGGMAEIGSGDTGIRIRAWGDNGSAQLGQEPAPDFSLYVRPVKMEYLIGRAFDLHFDQVDSLSFSDTHACVGGDVSPGIGGGSPFEGVMCWGRNNDGELGNASLTTSFSLVRAAFPSGTPAGPFQVS